MIAANNKLHFSCVHFSVPLVDSRIADEMLGQNVGWMHVCTDESENSYTTKSMVRPELRHFYFHIATLQGRWQ